MILKSFNLSGFREDLTRHLAMNASIQIYLTVILNIDNSFTRINASCNALLKVPV
jgi:hypothetical protein